jgi:hypothetical protein
MSRTGSIPLSTTNPFYAKKGPGARYLNDDFLAATGIASIGQVVQTKTLTVSTNTNAATYTWSIDGVTLTATGGSTATLTGDAIVAAIEANALANAAVSAVNASGTVTLTSRQVSQVFYLASTDTKLTVADGAAQDVGDAIDFGAAIVKIPNGSGFLCGQAAAAGFTAKAAILTPTAVNSTLYEVNITLHPNTYVERIYTAAYTSDGSATVKEIVEGLAASVNAVMPADTVLATEDDTTLTLTAEVAGFDFLVGINANIAVAAYTGTTLAALMVGISASDDGSVVATATDSNTKVTKILGGQRFTYYREGQIIVETAATPALTNPVCVRVAGTGALFSTAPSSSYIPVPTFFARWMPAPDITSTSRGVVQLDFA